MVTGNGFPKLLQCPVCRRMRGHVVVENTAAADFHHEKDEEHLEPDRHSNQKVAGDDPLGMILDERSPVLRGGPPAAASRPVAGANICEPSAVKQECRALVRVRQQPALLPKLCSPLPSGR